MSMLAIIILIAVLLLLIALSAFFSGSETALFSLSRARLLSYRNDPSKIRRAIVTLLDGYQKTLIALVLGNAFVNIGISLINNQLIAAIGLNVLMTTVLSIFIAVVVLLIFGEVTPKTIALVNSERLSAWSALPLLYFRWMLYPVIMVTDWIFSVILNLLGREKSHPLSHDEYASYIELAAIGGAFSHDEQLLLNKALELRETSVAELLIPRVNINTVNYELDADEVKAKIIEFKQPFIPIISQDIDDTEFLLVSKEFFWLSPEERSEWITVACRFPAVFMPLQCSLVQALRKMRTAGVPALLVVDEFGRTAGMITAKIIYSELVGQLNYDYEESDPEPEQLTDRHWRVSGNDSIVIFNELTGRELPDDCEANTMNGLLSDLLGRIPEVDDTVTIDSVILRVEKVEQHCVKQLIMEVSK
ncbi:MAG: hemolysin family protein [Victivallaceae bacterium]|nr:hemolysin family protein [Victivallaceae bacterium]